MKPLGAILMAAAVIAVYASPPAVTMHEHNGFFWWGFVPGMVFAAGLVTVILSPSVPTQDGPRMSERDGRLSGSYRTLRGIAIVGGEDRHDIERRVGANGEGAAVNALHPAGELPTAFHDSEFVGLDCEPLDDLLDHAGTNTTAPGIYESEPE